MTRILIGDDHAIVRKGLVQILADGSGPITVDEADSGEEALLKAMDNDYDLVLLDISLPGKSGLEVLKELKRHRPELSVLMLSMHSEEQYAVQSLRAGASGYLTKGSAPDELITAIRKVQAGGRYVSAAFGEKLAFGLVRCDEKPIQELLSNRELQVFSLLATGKPISAIAFELSLSVKTISTFRARILKKMNMKNNAEIIHYAFDNKLV